MSARRLKIVAGDPREETANNGGMILVRLIAIALRKYREHPEQPSPAIRMLLRNVIRLSVEHLGRAEVESIARDTFTEARQ